MTIRMRLLWSLSLWACVMTRVLVVAGAQEEGGPGQQQVNGTASDCECTPRCEALEETTPDCNKVPRDDCPCCSVCEQESKCSLDTDCPDSRFCLGGMCADPCELLQPCKNTLEGGLCKAIKHRPSCICKDGWIKNSDANVCVPMDKNNTGCVYKERLYSSGEVLYRDSCTEQCRCGSDGQFTCNKPTCPPGLFLTGQHDRDELCIELRNRPGTDDCCVVVVCANSLSKPTSLSSPSKFPPLDAKASFDRVNGIRALAGSTTTTKPLIPVSEDDYQKNIKELESVLNGKFTKKDIYEDGVTKKPITDNVNIKSTTADIMEENTESPFGESMEKHEQAPEETTELNIKDEAQNESDVATTVVPPDMMDGPAVIVDYDDLGNQVQKMSLNTEVDIVTLSPNILEEESATEHIVHQSLDPSQHREPRQDEGDLNSTRDKKSGDISSNLEEKESIGKPSSTGLKALVVTHNSTTLFLPSTKGGELFYKDAKSSVSEWVRQEVEAGQDSTVLRGLMPNSHYTLKWSGKAGNSAKINIETKDGCSKEGSTWTVGEDWTVGCQEKCRCRPGGKLECQPRCLFAPGSITDPLCTEKPTAEDPDCCVVYDCRSPDDPEPVSPTSTLDSEPKLIVTTKSHNFITLAWENFSRSAEGVYVAEYRQSPKDESNYMSTEDSWQKTSTIQGNQMPSVTIDNLAPNTMYQVRVSMIDDDQPGRIFATETINVKTEVGCIYSNESYGVGEFMVGCEERCTCYANSTYDCTQPCELPYFRVGSFANDSYCLEQRADPEDECCILAICASSAGETEYEPCSNIVCGKNAECVSGVAPNERDDVGYCRCNPGFIGDAKDLGTGCVKDSAAKELTCTFKNDTYKPGDVFYDSCDYKCSCSSNGELECQPRCEFPHKNGAATEAGCQYLPDPNDDCCKLRVCNSTSEAATDAARAPLLPTDGCTFGNKTFAKDEKFSDGCDQNCTCMGYGDVSCFPRCPPIKELPGAKCHTLPDPQDTCCTITFCADKPIDVMKANVTENSINEEANKNMTEEEFVHIHGNLTHTHQLTAGENHTHENVTEHMHVDVTHDKDEHMHGNMTHSHPHIPGDNHTHEENEHTHDDTTHSHPHVIGDNHTHEEPEHTHGNMTHSHSHIPGDNHTHEELEHTHGNMTHSHPHIHGDNHTHKEHEHTHDNMTHSHPHVIGDNHTHEENEHTHGNMSHSHPHIPGDNHTHEDNMTLLHDHEHIHDHTHANVTHSHQHDDEEEHDHNSEMAHKHEHNNETHHDHVHGHNETWHRHPHSHDNETHSHHFNENELETTDRSARIDLPLHELHIVEVAAINDTAVKIRVAVSDSVIEEILPSTSQFITVHYSKDSLMWMEREISVTDISVENLNEILMVISDLEPSTPYQFRVDFDGVSSSTSKGGPLESPINLGGIDIDTSSVCNHNGEYYKIGEEFYEGCARFCFCGQNLEVHCADIECPETFGLDVIDPDCLEWDHEPDFVPTPPRCCGTVTCKESAACPYEGQTFRNFDLLPTELTGCDKRCSCSYGNITCTDVCPPISDQPPPNLNCFPGPPIKETMSGEFCCLEWKCPQSSVVGPPDGVSFPLIPGTIYPISDYGFSEPLVMPIDSNTVRFTFSIPPQYKGLPGDIYVRYIKTEDLSNSADPKSWLKQDVGTEGFISKVTWVYVMKNLEPGSHYSMQLVLQPYGIDPVTSPIFEVMTQAPVTDIPITTSLPFLEVDAELHASQVSSSEAKITWRKFSDYELQYIDGFQIKYIAEGKLMPKFSQYFHRDNHMIMLRDLEPGTNYTVDLVFLEQGPTPVYNTKNITFETLRVEDPYAFDITVEQGKIDIQTATFYYSGVPEPEEKYVNIYRAIYLLENDQIDDQSFKIPKAGDEKTIFLNDLKPDTEYEVWIEAYLANGRKKKSNVVSIKTKAGELPTAVERSEIQGQNLNDAGGDDYYGALVAVAIIAAIACLGFLGLLLILLRRNNHGNATINSSSSDAAYDNPSYKVGDNQTYDMEMNGLSGKNGNGAAHTDDP